MTSHTLACAGLRPCSLTIVARVPAITADSLENGAGYATHLAHGDTLPGLLAEARDYVATLLERDEHRGRRERTGAAG